MIPQKNELNASLLIVEDGNEYFENFVAFLPGLQIQQAHDGATALRILQLKPPTQLVFLDMRFDRTARQLLLGDPQEVLDGYAATLDEAWSFLEKNQGLYIYRAIRQAGLVAVPILISYDFSRELDRWTTVARGDERVAWVADSATPDDLSASIRNLIDLSK
ncbi:MAG: hypothetical protein ABIJ09_05220 [Pseudomonadota bacterium]